LNSGKVILSLCDYSGNWSRPYREAGYTVKQIDLQFGQDVRLLPYPGNVHGILAAPTCTQFACCGARWRAQEKADGTYDAKILEALSLVDACLRLVAVCRPVFWCVENPIGTLRNYLGPPVFSFNPCDFANWSDGSEAYTKKTLLWGTFNTPLAKPVAPVGCRKGQPNQWYSRVGGSGAKTKAYRSLTPVGFANAFFAANP
jgi:hypothetical protein